MSLFSKRRPEPSAIAEFPPGERDFLGSPAVSVYDTAAAPEDNVAYRRSWLPVGVSIRLIYSLSALVAAMGLLVVALLVRENSRVQVGPQVFMQSEIGKLIPIETLTADTKVATLEAFLHHVVSNLTEVRSGEITKASVVKGLMDERVFNDIQARIIRALPRLKADRVSISSSITRIDTSSPERFVINRRLRRSLGVAYGDTLTVTGNGGGRNRVTRWDFEIVLVPRTVENGWGLFITQLIESPIDKPYTVIPPDLRRPEDLMPSDSR